MNRRKFIRTSVLASLGAALGTGLYTWQIEPFWLEFVRQKMNIINLPTTLEGKTLMQISDIHVGNRIDLQYLKKAFKKAQKLNPDFVVYTGDFVSYVNKKQFDQLEDVMSNAVLGKLGTLAVLGNHDYGHNWSEQHVADQIAKTLESKDIKVLGNDHTEISGLKVIGLDDYWGPNFSPKDILKAQGSDAHLVLCHNPDVCDLDVWSDYQGWILAGHTHGGQCKSPFLPPPILPVKNKKYTSGKITLNNNRTLYINRALGFLHQVRFNVRPEITVFNLTNSA